MKRSVTLIEMMIVILLIGLIGGALAFNMRGSMDQGRKFKTEQNISRVQDILMMEWVRGGDINDIIDKPKFYLDKSKLVKDSNTILKDGWGNDLTIKFEEDEIVVISPHK